MTYPGLPGCLLIYLPIIRFSMKSLSWIKGLLTSVLGGTYLIRALNKSEPSPCLALKGPRTKHSKMSRHIRCLAQAQGQDPFACIAVFSVPKKLRLPHKQAA